MIEKERISLIPLTAAVVAALLAIVDIKYNIIITVLHLLLCCNHK